MRISETLGFILMILFLIVIFKLCGNPEAGMKGVVVDWLWHGKNIEKFDK